MKEYALYRGDEIVCIGTLDEIAEQQNVQIQTVRYYGTQAYRRKRQNSKDGNYYILVCLDEDDMD